MPPQQLKSPRSVHRLTKSYSELEVLRDIDFEVARGSLFALLGPNVAGTSTVVTIQSTSLKAGVGEATVNGWPKPLAEIDAPRSCQSRRWTGTRTQPE